MSFGRLHKWVTYGIAALGLAALSIGPELELSSELLIFAGLAASWFVDGPLIRDPRWARGWTVGLLALVGLQILRGLGGAPLLPLVLEFTAALQISRLFNRRGAREHQQIAALALLHLIAATVISTELSYGLAFLGFVIVTPWMLSLGHLRAEIEGQQRGEDADRAQAVERVLASRRLVGPSFLLGTAALALPLFAMTGLLFVAFPRVGLGFLSFGRDLGQPVSGFGANVELGDFGVIRSDPTVVLRVVPPDLGAQPPRLASLRMRGTSFDHYDGRRWTRSRELAVGESVGHMDAFYGVPRRMPQPAQDRPWRVVLDPLEEPVVFLPPSTVGLEVPPRIVGGVEVGREVVTAPGVDIRYADADGLGLRYTAWTSDAPEDRSVEPLDDGERARYLELPEGHDRVAALAREWTAGADDDAAKVRALVSHLRDSGDYEYSLEMPDVGDRPPVEAFLLEARRGHCEYYSTAMAVMLRSVGVPSRNVTGFLGGRFNDYGGYYALSQGDAHSWVEAWLPGRGWVTVDPTPSSRDAFAPDAGWLSALREMADAIRTRWSDDVVGYDLRSQVGLFRAARRWLSGTEGRGPAAAEPTRSQGPGPSIPGWVWLVAAMGVLAVLVFLGRRRRRRSRATEHAASVRLYRAFDATLAKLGHPRPPERTPNEQVAALADAGFRELELARQITRRYLEARFGGETLSADEIDRLLREVKALRGRTDLFRSPP